MQNIHWEFQKISEDRKIYQEISIMLWMRMARSFQSFLHLTRFLYSRALKTFSNIAILFKKKGLTNINKNNHMFFMLSF